MPDNENKNKEEEIELVTDEENDASVLHAKLKKSKEELKRCEDERKDYLEGWQRSKADSINYRRDDGKRLEDMARFATASLVQEFLAVLDSFDLALNHDMAPETERGVLLIRSQFEDILKKRGLEKIPARLEEEFNPEKHESLGEAESEHPAGTIAEIVQHGYTFQGRVLRPARVRISK